VNVNLGKPVTAQCDKFETDVPAARW